MKTLNTLIVIFLIFTGLALADPEESNSTPAPEEGETATPKNEETTPSDKIENGSPEKKTEEKKGEEDKKDDEKKLEDKKDEEKKTSEEKKEAETKLEDKKDIVVKKVQDVSGESTNTPSEVDSLAKLSEATSDISTPAMPKKDHSGEISEEKKKDIKVEVKESKKEIGNLNLLGEIKVTPSAESRADKIEKLEKQHGNKTNVIGSDVASSISPNEPGDKAQKIDVPPATGYSCNSSNKAPADHKMTITEQQAYICSLPKLEGDLCPMTINLEENVGISDPGANAYCNDMIAAPMGYKGFCVVLMKNDPSTGLPIYTKTCAYFDKEKNKCSTNFITSQAQTNSSQVAFQCPNNGFVKYIPTSCVKKQIIRNELPSK